MIWARRGSGHPPAMGEGGPLETVRVAVDGAAAGGWEALNRLVEVLVEVDDAGDEVVARSALTLVAGVSELVARLDGQVRQAPWYGPYQEPALRLVGARFSVTTSGPVAMALASMHGDGRVRERAIEAMVGRPCPEVMPFLVLRTGDWVKPVRDRARAGLALLLADDPGGYLPAALPMALRVDVRRRGGFAVTQVRAAMLSASAELWRGLLGSGGRQQRRFVFDLVLAQGWLRLPDHVTCAETDPDVWIRGRAAEAACREAVWTRRHDVLRRLARSIRAEVRVVALTGLVRVGLDTEVASYLDDDAPLVRAVARDAARRAGIDAREHYRAAVRAGEPALGAIVGLAETGSAADVPLLRPLLSHPRARVRAQAVRGLRLLDAVVAEELLPLLWDPSAAVVREVTAALRPLAGALPPGLPWELLGDARVELRRAGYRLLRGHGLDVELRAGLMLSLDRDSRLAERGKADVTRLARNATRTSWRRTPPSELPVTAAQHGELVALAARAAAALGEDTSRMLTTWLAGTPAGG
ncbi:HEAT repeat domain-containing protein [Micromonospora sp. WMMD812]|uniref:HEAT repeat domain-containing protein n=1 Tax=Micromonospora sp. WMMD812 TaxID=3015152 RepID=UPI00248AA211|nr:HEAT repeat domain-containing protein [Micromonospora sp. WMMD812]WBB67744.1 HEAT repeat domain-containing protein [Micromonospora sp. WMMD812]